MLKQSVEHNITQLPAPEYWTSVLFDARCCQTDIQTNPVLDGSATCCRHAIKMCLISIHQRLSFLDRDTGSPQDGTTAQPLDSSKRGFGTSERG